MPHRITRPWLLFDWIYSMTDTASAEINQKNKLDAFTRKVSPINGVSGIYSSYFPLLSLLTYR